MANLSLADELAGGSTPSCKVCAYLRTLSPADAKDWQQQLARPVVEIGNMAVVNALGRRGVDLTEVSVRRHRSRHVPRG